MADLNERDLTSQPIAYRWRDRLLIIAQHPFRGLVRAFMRGEDLSLIDIDKQEPPEK